MTVKLMNDDAQGVWAELIGQEHVVTILQEAAYSARNLLSSHSRSHPQVTVSSDEETGDTNVTAHQRPTGANPSSQAMTHAWLLTGPPGSGRSIAARMFAAALQCTGPQPGCGECSGCRTTIARTHPDVEFLATDKTIIDVRTARELVPLAQSAPSQGRFRVIVIEDADRLNEFGANALLKAIEEPPERTVWLLCAPSLEDMISTIRSRCRHVALRIPPAQAVADLLVREGTAQPDVALEAARAAQSHIGLARALAQDPQMRQRRRQILTAPLRANTVGQAVRAAAELHETAKTQAEAQTAERNAREKAELLRQLGMEETDKATKQSRALVKQLEEDQKRRAKRALNDALDRALVDLMAAYRDVLMLQFNTGQTLINDDLGELVEYVARNSNPGQTLRRIDSIEEARRRLHANGNVLLVLEAMVISLQTAA